jgi:outer membrane protein assembly factor BamA
MNIKVTGRIMLISVTVFLVASAIAADVLAFEGTVQDSGGAEARRGVVLLPILSYMPETKTAVGVLANYYFHESGGGLAIRPSTIMPAVVYTQKRQFSAEVLTDLYWDEAAYNLRGYISYREYPDKFYGIGNDTDQEGEEDYTPRGFQLRLDLQKKALFGSYIGLRYEREYLELIEVEEDGTLDHGDIPGSDSGTASGLGISAKRDTRNSVFFPSTGSLFKLSMLVFHESIGSRYDFTRFRADIRRYYELSESNILAADVHVGIMDGTVPFHMLSLLGQIGERNLMRGYYQGRYRDKNMLSLQVEYRRFLWWRIGAVAFVGVGDVAAGLDEFTVETFKYSYGGGLRFQLDRKEKINLRLDFGLGKDVSGLYFAIGEAF